MRDSHLFERLLLAGTAFGAGLALGLLLAPEAGRDTRERIASGARETSLAAQERGKEWVSPVAERARGTATALGERHLPLADDWDVIDPQSVRDSVR